MTAKMFRFENGKKLFLSWIFRIIIKDWLMLFICIPICCFRILIYSYWKNFLIVIAHCWLFMYYYFLIIIIPVTTYSHLVFSAILSSFYLSFYDTWFWYFFSLHVLPPFCFDSYFWVALLRWLLLSMHLFQIVYSVDDTCFLTYCEMVSKQQYEEQRVSTSTEALRGLLHGIIIDENLSEKERRKRIKQACAIYLFK